MRYHSAIIILTHTKPLKVKDFIIHYVYGHPDKALEKQIWNHLIDLTLIRDASWFLAGDVNDILENSEKEGGPAKPESSFGDFRTFF